MLLIIPTAKYHVSTLQTTCTMAGQDAACRQVFVLNGCEGNPTELLWFAWAPFDVRFIAGN